MTHAYEICRNASATSRQHNADTDPVCGVCAVQCAVWSCCAALRSSVRALIARARWACAEAPQRYFVHVRVRGEALECMLLGHEYDAHARCVLFYSSTPHSPYTTHSLCERCAVLFMYAVNWLLTSDNDSGERGWKSKDAQTHHARVQFWACFSRSERTRSHNIHISHHSQSTQPTRPTII